MICKVSGLSGSKETAQSQVSVGMGLLAGSTVLLLTVIWGTCVVVGKCDIVEYIAVDAQNTRGFNLTGIYLIIIVFMKTLNISYLYLNFLFRS